MREMGKVLFQVDGSARVPEHASDHTRTLFMVSSLHSVHSFICSVQSCSAYWPRTSPSHHTTL